MTYENLLAISDEIGLTVKEKDLQAYDGRIHGTRIAIRKGIATYTRKACVLAEELGHYFTSSGDVLEDSPLAQKQELKARKWAYDLQIGLSGLIEAKKAGCRNLYEMSEHLGVTESFLKECIRCYSDKYGERIQYQDHVITFAPYLDVVDAKEYERAKNDW